MIVSPLGLDDKESGGVSTRIGVQEKEEEEMVEKWGVVE